MEKHGLIQVSLIHGHVKKAFTENTGGGCMVDYLPLGDGACLGINDECVVLYSEDPSKSEDYPEDSGAFYFSTAMMEKYRETPVQDNKPAEAPLTFIKEVKAVTHDKIIYYNLIEHDNGGVIIIDDVNICIYENYAAFLKDDVWATIER